MFNENLLKEAKKIGRDFKNIANNYFQFNIEIEIHHQLLKSPLLTNNPEEADLFYVPLYTTVSEKSNLNLSNLSSNLLSELDRQKYFRQHNGKDHIFSRALPLFWPQDVVNIYPFISKSIILSLELGRSKKECDDWNERKNIIVPYLSYHPQYHECPLDQNKTTLVYVSMNLRNRTSSHKGRLRTGIHEIIKNMKGGKSVIFDRSSRRKFEQSIRNIPLEMTNSKYCIVARGDSYSSKRFYDAIRYGCIPIVLSDYFQFAYQNVLINYQDFVIRIPENHPEQIPQVIQSISEDKYQEMRKKMKEASSLLKFNITGKPEIGEGFWAFSWMLYIKTRLMRSQN
jgi:hypothetical protein